MDHFHMNGGIGETSYHSNSSIQRLGVLISKSIIEEAVFDIFRTTDHNNNEGTKPMSTISIADLGCSSGPNTLLLVSYVMDAVYAKCCGGQQSNSIVASPLPEFLVFLNDLPRNDFNTIFMSLPSYYEKLKETKGDGFGSCFIAGIPGSFYGRLFPSESLHLIHSFYSLHWLSQVPLRLSDTTKGTIYIAKSSPRSDVEAYLKQFESDFSMFLRSRSNELVHKGRMVLTLLGRTCTDPSSDEGCNVWRLLEIVLNDMVSTGLIEEGKLESFNLPYYSPSPMEIKSVIQTEGSFVINRLKTFKMKWDVEIGTPMFDKFKSSSNIAKYVRAAVESLIVSHFGETIDMNQLFSRYREIIEDCISKHKSKKHTTIVISMTKKSINSVKKD